MEKVSKDSTNSINDFSFNEYGGLTDCSFHLKIPIRLKDSLNFLDATLNIEIVLEKSKHPKSKLFALSFGTNTFDLKEQGETELSFESQMIFLQRLLPKNIRIHTCLFCAYSNYWVGGSNSFGTLICYKDIKDKILTVKGKSEYIDAAEGRGESTQETFLCSEFMEIGEDQWQYKDTIW